MSKFRKAKTIEVEICERCGSVCGAACQAERARQKFIERALLHGWRIA